MIANIFACGFVVLARFFHVLNLPVMCIAAWRVIEKNNFFIPFIENCSGKSLRLDSFFLCYTVIYRNAVSWIVLNLFVEMPKAVRGVYVFACKVLVR